MPPNAQKIRDILSGLPVEDRLSALSISIIECNPNALAVSFRMLNATTALSKGLFTESRIRVAEAMRDRADLLERPQAVRIDWLSYEPLLQRAKHHGYTKR